MLNYFDGAIRRSKKQLDYIRHVRRFRFLASVSLFVLSLICMTILNPIVIKEEKTEATSQTSETTLALSSSNIVADVKDGAFPDGRFFSASANVTITTTNYTGYVFSIRAKNDNENYSKLMAGEESLTSIEAAVDADDFNTDSSYNGFWGYRPSKLDSAANEDFLPAPTFAGSVLDDVGEASTETYKLELGTRINNEVKPGSYSNTFVLSVVANMAGYQITYDKNTTDAVLGMPTSQSGNTADATIALRDATPTRTGHTFLGWCDAATVGNPVVADACDKGMYDPGDNFGIDQTTNNVVTMYAMWGTDSGSVDFTCNFDATSIDNAVCMQDINSAVRNSMVSGVQYKLADSRDNKTYFVSKLADNRIWLLDNLALDLTAQNASTNITAANTNASAEALTALFTGVQGGGTNGNLARTAVSSDWQSDSYTEPLIDTSDSDKTVKEVYEEDENHSGETYEGIDANWKIGNYYNYCAASAGSYCYESAPENTDAQYDICPAGWRMPTSGYDEETDENIGEYATLYSAYSGESDQYTAFRAALRAPLSGYFYNGSVRDQGGYGSFWSSTRYDDYGVYSLHVDEDNVYPGDYYDRVFGSSVRCVANIYYMQDVDATKLNALMPNVGDSSALYDKRDGAEYIVGKLADGKYWMLDNLALDLTAENASTAITAVNTNASADSLSALFNGVQDGGGNGNLARTIVSANWSSNSYTDPLIDVTNKDDTMAEAVGGAYEEMDADWPVGIYYNYCAASAGSYCYEESSSPEGINVTEDICPSGWKMPASGYDDETGEDIGEYATLYRSYQNESNQYAAFRTALRIPLSGVFDSGSVYSQGTYGTFWSSTRYYEYSMYDLYVDTENVVPSTNERIGGSSVRCLFNQP